MIHSLFLSADPVNTPRINLVKESNDIDSQLRLLGIRDQFVITERHVTSLSELQLTLMQLEPDIVHFSGYGSNGGSLVFHDARHILEEVDPKVLSILFRVLKRKIHCVVLSMCYSETQAEAISKHVGCVIGLPKEMPYETANIFLKGYYQALGVGRTIEEAFTSGLNNLKLLALDNNIKPILKESGEKDVLKLRLTENRSFAPNKTLAGKELEKWEVERKLKRTLQRPPLRKLLTLKSQLEGQELRDIRTSVNDLRKEYDKFMNNERSLSDFYHSTLPIIKELLMDQETTKASDLKLSLGSIYNYMREYTFLRNIGDESQAQSLNSKISHGILSILDKLDEQHLR